MRMTVPFLLAALAALPIQAQEAAPAATAAAPLPAITVSAVSRHDLSDRVIASGLVEPVETVQVQPLIEGQPIESLLADVGDRVSAGQVLAVLSKTALELQKSQYQASLAAARAGIAQAEAALAEAQANADEAARAAARSAALRRQGNVSQAADDQTRAASLTADARVMVARQALEAAGAQLSLVEAQLANVELQLSRTRVVSPVGGEITARNAQVGAIASAAGQPMFTLIRDGALELRADVAEGDLLRLATGQKAALKLAGSSETLSGTVRLVEPTIDPATRLGRARIAIDDPARIRAGMFAQADILVAERNTLAVPVSAVGAAGTQPTVMRVTGGGVVEQVFVTTGIRQGEWVEITGGLTQGDRVVTRAGAFVRAGDRINPVPAGAGTN